MQNTWVELNVPKPNLHFLFNNKHFKNKNELINKIDSILVNSDLNKIRLFYKILKTIVE